MSTQEKAEADLLYALKQCHRKAVGNRRRILKYLVRNWLSPAPFIIWRLP